MVAKQQKTSNNIWHRGFNGSIKISFTHHCPSAHPSYQPTASAPMDSFQFFASVQVPELCHGCVLLWVQIVFQLRILVPDDAALHSSFFFSNLGPCLHILVNGCLRRQPQWLQCNPLRLLWPSVTSTYSACFFHWQDDIVLLSVLQD